jgi:hypothetical protein
MKAVWLQDEVIMDQDTLTLEIYTKMKAAATEGNMLTYAGELARKILGSSPSPIQPDGEIIRRPATPRPQPVAQEVVRPETQRPPTPQPRSFVEGVRAVATSAANMTRTRTDTVRVSNL